MGEVLTWHVSMCMWCWMGQNRNPPAFGIPDDRKCPEYYEIVAEYSEYEATYIKMGNP